MISRLKPLKKQLIPKEISWLSFNHRVLQEAMDPNVPLIERIKYLGIYSNNMDEFFRVRFASLKRLSRLNIKAVKILGYNPKTVLKEIHKIVISQNILFEETYQNILKELGENNIQIINEEQLSLHQKEYVREYFHKKILPNLMPVILSQANAFPDLNDDSIYLAITMVKKNNKPLYSLIEVPSKIISRFITVPSSQGIRSIIMLDDVIRFGLNDIFRAFKVDFIKANTIKVTKDAELDISDDTVESYVKKISKSLKKREEGNPVRFVFDADIPTPFLNLLIMELRLTKEDVMVPGGRYHNFKDFINFPETGKAELTYPAFKNVSHPDFRMRESILKVIKQKDILLHFPYHGFDNFIDFLREVSIDPKVVSVKISLYRLARNSSVVNALINAAKNGKMVTAVVELQARFDEEANILWSEKLREEGVRVIFGTHGLKVHAKLCLVIRKEKNDLVEYACLGTGNFNEETSHIYSDHMLMTSNPKITNEVNKTFDFFDKNYELKNFRHLLFAPVYMRKKILKMIQNEISNVTKGKKAYIYLKINNLVDNLIISKLYEAADAGVKIKLNVRGMFSMMPDKAEKKENIEAIAIIDRFLEHSRFFIFCNEGNPIVYLSSADLMQRNLDKRIEIAFPVFDENLKAELIKYWEIQWNDFTKARILDSKLRNEYRKHSAGNRPSAQENIYTWLKQLNSVPPEEETPKEKPEKKVD